MKPRVWAASCGIFGVHAAIKANLIWVAEVITQNKDVYQANVLPEAMPGSVAQQ